MLRNVVRTSSRRNLRAESAAADCSGCSLVLGFAEMRRVVLLLASLVCVSVSPIGATETQPSTATATPEASAVATARATRKLRAELSAALLAETNRVRRTHGRSPLRSRAGLDDAADDQAAFMMMTTSMSHVSPIRGQRTPADRVSRHGVEPAAVAENIAWYPIGTNPEPPSAQEVAAILVEQWMNSPGHRANLLSPNFTHFGGAIRIAQFLNQSWCAYGVQVFVVPRGRS
jgi:uncharacterized protein YkwD